MFEKPSENPTMKWHRSLRDSNTVVHPPISIGRRYYRASLKKAIKEARRAK